MDPLIPSPCPVCNQIYHQEPPSSHVCDTPLVNLIFGLGPYEPSQAKLVKPKEVILKTEWHHQYNTIMKPQTEWYHQ